MQQLTIFLVFSY